jgi:hypothetical protein
MIMKMEDRKPATECSAVMGGYCCLPNTDILGGAIKENPTPVLTTDPRHHSDDRFGVLSPRIAMHAYHQDIPAGV